MKQRLWHDNVEATLEQLERVSFDLDLDHQSGGQQLLVTQQIEWIPERAHLLLQTRIRVYMDDIEAAFREWYL